MTIKFRIMSDLHLEFYRGAELERFPLPFIGEDYLILAGDVQVRYNSKEWFVELLKYRNVIYVLGNHEFYNGDFRDIRSSLPIFNTDVNAEALIRGYKYRLYSLDGTDLVIDERIRVTGGTLWTNLDTPWALYIMQRMNDYHLISNGNGKVLNPADTSKAYRSYKKAIRNNLNTKDSLIDLVVTHHLPSFRSIDPRYKGDPMNAAYASKLDSVVKKADIWVHGHTHASNDYMLGKCRVISNPKGYIDENVKFDINKIIEV